MFDLVVWPARDGANLLHHEIPYMRDSEGDGQCPLRRIGPGRLVKERAD